MRVLVGNLELKVPVVSQYRSISLNTPHTRFLLKSWRDLVQECRAIYAVIQLIPASEVKFVVDAMAGSGFSTAVMRQYFVDASFHLNDLSSECRAVLTENYPHFAVTGEDVTQWQPPNCDLIFLDFNNFTLKRLSYWKAALERASQSSGWLMFTDSACYGFAMGTLGSYGLSSSNQYYYKLGQDLREILGRGIRAVCGFGHAAVVLMAPVGLDAECSYLEPANLLVDRIEGFGF